MSDSKNKLTVEELIAQLKEQGVEVQMKAEPTQEEPKEALSKKVRRIGRFLDKAFIRPVAKKAKPKLERAKAYCQEKWEASEKKEAQ